MSEHPFRKMVQGQGEAVRALARSAYEESKVRYFLRVFGLDKRVERRLRDREKETRDAWFLSFHSLAAEFPTFPWLLGTDPLDGVRLHLEPKAMLPALFKNFEGAPFVAAFDAFMGRMDLTDSRGHGLVFRRKGIPGGLLITDDVVDVPLDYCGFWGASRRADGRTLYLLSYASLLCSMRDASSWHP